MSGRHAAPGRLQRRQERRKTETAEFAAMLTRMLYAYGYRVSQDPADLGYLRDLEAAFRDAVNLGIYAANKLGDRPYGIGEIGKILGITKQSVHARVKAGEDVYVRLEAARSAGALVRLDDIRAGKARALAAAGVDGTSSSPRELAAGNGGGR
jgi:hypothetical protein